MTNNNKTQTQPQTQPQPHRRIAKSMMTATRTTTTAANMMIMFMAANICFTAQGFSNNQLNHFRRHQTTLVPASSSASSLPNIRNNQLGQLFSSTKDKTAEVSSKSSSSSSTQKQPQTEEQEEKFIPLRAMDIYVNYVTRLWEETNTNSREKIANQKAFYAVKHVKHLLQDGEEYVNIMNDQEDDTKEEIEKRAVARGNLLNACNVMLDILGPMEEDSAVTKAAASAVTNGQSANGSTEGAVMDVGQLKAVVPVVEDGDKKAPQKKKGSRSILFGAAMGGAVAAWVFSGNFLFTAFFTLMTILGQLEYYRMVMQVGIYPARKISVVGACAMFVTALFAPQLHQIVLPIFASYAMIWFLTMRRKVSTIPEIASTFTGMFYLGYVPSFWVRIRLIQAANQPVTLLRPIVGPFLDSINAYAKSAFPYFARSIHSPITYGSVFIFWTWLSIAFSDVGAYFTGRKYGNTKLGSIFPAAGAASPNKTVEGYLGGSATCALFATLGAWVMQWPYWYLTGPIHGISLAFLGLVGDLTASMLKRDSGLKDFGDLLPEHGGIMDRVDSFVFTAPYSWIVCQFVIPALRAKSRLAIP